MVILGKIFKAILLIFFIFILHTAATNILPYPFNHLNIIYLGIFYLVFLSQKPRNIWYLAPLVFLSDLFGATPFGLNFAVYFFLTLFMSWLFANIFTARTLPFITLYFIIGLTAYRIFFNILNYLVGRFMGTGGLDPQIITFNIIIEILTTTVFMIIFHILYSSYYRHFNPKYLNQ